MKLYAFHPKGHGQFSFFVCSETEIEAKMSVEEYIKKNKDTDEEQYLDDFSVSGWGTDHYRLTVLKPNDVAVNAND